MKLQLENRDIWQSVPFVIRVESESEKLPERLLLQSQDAKEVDDFWVRVKSVGEKQGISELSLHYPGRFTASIEGQAARLEFLVRKREDLSFGSEFTLLAVLSLFIAGGILIWTQKRRT